MTALQFTVQYVLTTYTSEMNKMASVWRVVDGRLAFGPHEKARIILESPSLWDKMNLVGISIECEPRYRRLLLGRVSAVTDLGGSGVLAVSIPPRSLISKSRIPRRDGFQGP